MIKIQKSSRIPSVLSDEDIPTIIERHRGEAENGTLNINRGKYRAKTVVDRLHSDQYNKCCYCDRRVERSFNDVEHYRPKKSVRENVAHNGYWWLAYDWQNLLYSCPDCNRSGKNDQFPIITENNRAFNPDDNLDDEEPMIVNPLSEDAETCFYYEIEENESTSLGGNVFIRPTNNNQKDKANMTIQVLKLNREDLRENRYGHFSTFQFVIDQLFNIFPSQDALGKQKIKNHISNTLLNARTEYSGMLRDYIRTIESQSGVSIT